jgi:hypothetical protein
MACPGVPRSALQASPGNPRRGQARHLHCIDPPATRPRPMPTMHRGEPHMRHPDRSSARNCAKGGDRRVAFHADQRGTVLRVARFAGPHRPAAECGTVTGGGVGQQGRLAQGNRTAPGAAAVPRGRHRRAAAQRHASTGTRGARRWRRAS